VRKQACRVVSENSEAVQPLSSEGIFFIRIDLKIARVRVGSDAISDVFDCSENVG
jgi:hypothetical protein